MLCPLSCPMWPAFQIGSTIFHVAIRRLRHIICSITCLPLSAGNLNLESLRLYSRERDRVFMTLKCFLIKINTPKTTGSLCLCRGSDTNRAFVCSLDVHRECYQFRSYLYDFSCFWAQELVCYDIRISTHSWSKVANSAATSPLSAYSCDQGIQAAPRCFV